MKVIFVGPSLSRAEIEAPDCTILPPAAQGDIARAVVGGATTIGLIDGVYETTAAVWHKEILFALHRGVRVLGAASMGALRAAECAAFGMEPVGEIAHRYVSGALDDDAAVAVVHAPAELGYAALSEALVDAEATILRLRNEHLVSDVEAAELLSSAAHCFFKQRTPEAIVEGVAPLDAERRTMILAAYKLHRVSLKRRDALLLVERMTAPEPLGLGLAAAPPAWTLAQPSSWRQLLAELDPGAMPG